MALDAFLRLAGSQQGPIKGSVVRKGLEQTIRVTAAHHRLETPFDAASGQITGRRRHGPYVVTKDVDLSTPKLATAWALHEPFSTWELRYFAPSATIGVGAQAGTQVNHLTVRLTGAAVVAIELTMPDTSDRSLLDRAEHETVTFTYQSIEWTWTNGAVTATDTWS